jgi:hypothetical protein
VNRLATITEVGSNRLLAASVLVAVVPEADGRTSMAFTRPADGTFVTGGSYCVDFGEGETWLIDPLVVPMPELPPGTDLVSCADARRITT